MAKEIININPLDDSKLEFEISMAGLNSKDSKIRLLISTDKDDQTMLLNCKLTNNVWEVTIPAKTLDAKLSYTFKMECIIYNYYFEVAHGDINFLDKKPTVTIKNVDDEKTVVNEFAVSDMTDHSAPTNKLLRTETKPKDTHGARVTTTVDPVDITDISSRVVPNQGISFYDEEESTDQVSAQDVIKNVIGVRKSTNERSNQGSIFKKDDHGRVWIPGLENKEQQQKLKENAIKIKSILS